MKKLIILFLLITSPSFSGMVQTTNGLINISNDSEVYNNSMFEGVVENLSNVTFVGWNFSRENPHTIVFQNCQNLIFIKCNLKNVELQSDFIIKDSLVFHEFKYEEGGINYKKVELPNGKTRIYEYENNIELFIEERDTPHENLQQFEKQTLSPEDAQYYRSITYCKSKDKLCFNRILY